MKLQTNNLRRLCLLVSLILLFAVLLPACSASSELPTEVTDELLERIEKDYAQQQYANGADPNIDGPWIIEYCYGIYDGCVAIMFATGVHFIERDVQIGEHTIHYRDTNSIYVWKAGDFFLLEDAYAQGWLTDSHIQTIVRIQNVERFSQSKE